MTDIITQLAKYIIVILFAFYTYECFSIFRTTRARKQQRIIGRQRVFMFLIHLIAFVVLYLQMQDEQIIVFYGAQAILLVLIQTLYTGLYPKISKLVLNNMCMLLSIGFIMLTRLHIDKAWRQFFIVSVSFVLSLIVPVIIRKLKPLRNWKYFYAGIGIVSLTSVFILGVTTYGARLGIDIAGFSIQPSELVKISFVFFVAASLQEDTSFRNLLITSVIAGFQVLILVVSRDLGAAVILFMTYVIMVYVATRKIRYIGAGLALGSVAAVVSYHLFSHVRIRVMAFRDPLGTYDSGGMQVSQSLFAIGTGGWFGMGLCCGMPLTIPVADEDFIFSAIAEEMGVIFAMLLILVCASCYVMFLNIAMQIVNKFYKLVALGLGSIYMIQTFLNIGGVTKFIPSTGVTLPLISYGGSSVLSTLLMFAIIQGLYILREDEEAAIHKLKEQRRREGVQ